VEGARGACERAHRNVRGITVGTRRNLASRPQVDYPQTGKELGDLDETWLRDELSSEWRSVSTTPLVSVVTSVYNGGRLLEKSIRSVLEQAGVEFEVVAVDDGSTDASPQILDRLAAQEPRLRVLHQANTGLTRALVRGCAEARGRFIARHDADDLSRPTRLARQAAALLADSRLSFVSCGVEAIGPEDEVLYETAGPESPEQATDLLLNHRHGPQHGSVMFRKDRYLQAGGYRPSFYFAQDADLWLRLGETGLLAYERFCLYSLRITPERLSSLHEATQRRLGDIAHECRAARKKGLPEDEVLRLASALRPGQPGVRISRGNVATELYFIGRCLLSRRDRRAARYFGDVLRRDPWSLRALVSLLQTYAVTRPGVARAV
jgi:Glycosyl transferase family 2